MTHPKEISTFSIYREVVTDAILKLAPAQRALEVECKLNPYDTKQLPDDIVDQYRRGLGELALAAISGGILDTTYVMNHTVDSLPTPTLKTGHCVVIDATTWQVQEIIRVGWVHFVVTLHPTTFNEFEFTPKNYEVVASRHISDMARTWLIEVQE